MDSATNELMELRNDLAAATARLDRILDTRGTAPTHREDLVGLDRTVAIERVLAASEGPMRPIEIWEELRRAGRTNDPKMEVQVTTYDLWKRGRIGKVGRGLYIAVRD